MKLSNPIPNGKKKAIIRFETEAKINRELEQMYAMALEEAALVMCAIHDNVLSADFWPKTSSKNLPKLHDGVWSLWRSYIDGFVSLEDMAAYSKEVGQQEIRGTHLMLTGEGKVERVTNGRQRRENALELLNEAVKEIESKEDSTTLTKKIRLFLQESGVTVED